MNPVSSSVESASRRLWLDHVTTELLSTGTLARYIAELSVTGLKSNARVFEQAIGNGQQYDEMLRKLGAQGLSSEEMFFEVALRDLTAAADMFRPIHQTSNGLDGWVSFEAAPLCPNDTYSTVRASVRLHTRAARPNLFVEIAGTPVGLVAIEHAVFLGIPTNVTLLLSRGQYLAAAHAYMRGLERRIAAGLPPLVDSIASLSLSPWGLVGDTQLAPKLRERIGLAVAARSYKAYHDILATDRWQKLAAVGARPQRLLWDSSRLDHEAPPDTDYVEALAAGDTICAVRANALLEIAEGRTGADPATSRVGDTESIFRELRRGSIDFEAVAARLQRERVVACSSTWSSLLAQIRRKSSPTAAMRFN